MPFSLAFPLFSGESVIRGDPIATMRFAHAPSESAESLPVY